MRTVTAEVDLYDFISMIILGFSLFLFINIELKGRSSSSQKSKKWGLPPFFISLCSWGELISLSHFCGCMGFDMLHIGCYQICIAIILIITIL